MDGYAAFKKNIMSCICRRVQHRNVDYLLRHERFELHMINNQ